MEIVGVVKEVPVPKEEPPEGLTYQFKIPEDAEAPKTTVPGPFLKPGVVLVITGVGNTEILKVLVFVFPPESLMVMV